VSAETEIVAPPSARWWRGRRYLIPVATVLALAGAFAAWGPIGIGSGPIASWSGAGTSVTGPAPRWEPAELVVSINAGHSGAVIDGIALLGSTSYPAPRILDIKGDGDQECDGTAWPLTGAEGFAGNCEAGGLRPLLGRPVPVSSHVDNATLGPVTYPGIGAAIEVAPPGSLGCWSVTSVIIHYHVGIRHYTASEGMDTTQCWNKERLAILQQPG